jgi:hypothetical protein
MKTVEWKGVTFTVVPISTPACSVRANGQRIWCSLAAEHSTDCAGICPEGPALLLEGDDLKKYLAAKLIGDV